jgi:hypothetical protein
MALPVAPPSVRVREPGTQRAILVADALVPVGVSGKVRPVDSDCLAHFWLDAVQRGKRLLNEVFSASLNRSYNS